MSDIIPFNYDEVTSKIIRLRGMDVLLDRDVAAIYQIETKRVNEAVRNNADKFPANYMFTLQHAETQELVEKFDRFKSLQHSTVDPHAFTERGLYMLATILKSKRATEATFQIIESFAKLREISHNIAAIHCEKDEKKQKGLVQRTGELISDLFLDEGDTTETESTLELNLMALKFKHSVKRSSKKKIDAV